MLLKNKMDVFKTVLVLMAISALVFMRFSYIEQDGKPRPIIGFNIEDEPYYITPILYDFLKENGKYPIEFRSKEMYWCGNRGYPLINLALRVYGNTYSAIRIPVILISILAVVLMFFAIRSFANKWLAYAVVLYLLSDFSFFSASRYMNPQIFSYFIFCFILFVFLKVQSSPIKYVLLGFLLVYLVFFNYIIEVYVLSGFSLFVLHRSITNRDYKSLIYYIIGGTLSLAAFLIYLKFNNFTIFEYFHSFFGHGGVSKPTSIFKDGIKNIYIAAFQIFSTNFLRFNPIILGLFIVSLIKVVYDFLIKKKKLSDVNLCLLYIFLFCFLECLFISNYAFKKLIVLQPAVIIFITYNILDLKSDLRNGWNVLFYLVPFIAVPFLVLSITSSRSYWALEKYDIYENLNVMIYLLFAIQVILFLVFYWWKKYGILIIVLCFVNTFLICQYYLNNPTYHYRNTLTSLRPFLKDKLIFEGLGLTWQFYSDAKVGINPVYYFDEGYNESIQGLRNEALKMRHDLISIERVDSQERKIRLTSGSLRKVSSGPVDMTLVKEVPIGHDILLIYDVKQD
jgi:hypothetical protein